RCVRDEHGFDPTAVAELEQKLLGPILRALARDDAGRGAGETRSQRRAQLARQVAHRLEVGDAAPVDPAENLTPPEGLVTMSGERGFERRTFQLGEVGVARRGGHGISHSSKNLPDSDISTRPALAPGM